MWTYSSLIDTLQTAGAEICGAELQPSEFLFTFPDSKAGLLFGIKAREGEQIQLFTLEFQGSPGQPEISECKSPQEVLNQVRTLQSGHSSKHRVANAA